MFRITNVAARVFKRQIHAPRPGACINFVRQFYENLVPGSTICDIDCPDHSFRKFTDDGQYLVSVSRNMQDIIVFRPKWLSYSFRGENCDHQTLTQKAKKFDSFFTHLYSISLGSSNEFICKEFFLYLENHQFGLFATSTTQTHEGAIHGLPSIDKITFHLVRLNDGVVMDEKSFCNDYVNLVHNTGVFLYENLLCILSLRHQTIHILQVRDSGNLFDVRSIGPFCLEDDELFLNSNSQCAGINKSRPQEFVHQSNNDIHHQQVTEANSFISGIKQRLLSFIFRKAWNEEPDPSLRVQHLKKKFYYHFQDYLDLIMLKQVQFLDRQHLLLKFGSTDGGVRNSDHHPAFFAVYNMETTEIVAFYQNSSEELYSLFERFYDYFHAGSRESVHANFISSHSNNIHALEQLQSMKSKASGFSQYVKKMLGTLPYTCQSQSPSPYFDLSLFRYDEKLISSTDRHRHSTDHPIKFISRRQPNVPKFKIKTGLDTGGADNRVKRSSFLFHPYWPLVLSIQQTYMQPTVVNIHLRL
ncbi:light-mediated development protein DET1-like isoform X1 [Zingiber officinale]|uniref:light-mediated development protein DET1-like isoform X1 n=2 Tax=Zingiber officinale TaxID=94328 RepID=UPI001C4B4113|nr:light-mediated development protein DET1-like isoform X1 [Zingiber officinale]